MNIVFDAHIFRWSKTGGVRRYFEEVISHLPHDWSPVLMGLDRNFDRLPVHPKLAVSRLTPLPPRRITQRLKRDWWQRRLLGPTSLLHPTFYQLTGGLRYTELKCKVVVTVYDFIHEAYQKIGSDASATLLRQREAIERADHLICISQATEDALLERYPDKQERSSVVYLGASYPVLPDLPDDSIFERPTFLFVGGRGGYKNFLFLLRAFAKACQSHPHIRLHVAGAPLSDDELWEVHVLGLVDRVESSVFPDETQLPLLYRKSVALLYPSWHEGFGLPPLEAMACGTLAVTGNRTSLPEVVQDAGLQLDPDDEGAWTECILSIANQQVPRAAMLKKGQDRAAFLSWEKCAAEHLEIYRKLA